MRSRLAGIERGELLDLIAESWLGRALAPLTLVHSRNAQTSLVQDTTRMLTLAFNYAHSERVAGDYAEFGVWTGRTLIEAWRIARKLGTPRRFFAFDSFKGLPELSGIDIGGRFEPGEYAADRPTFDARLKRAGVDPRDVTVVAGFFEDSLRQPEQIPLARVAVAWIDCDLYESTVPVLDYLTPRLSQGAVLIFDDWYCFQGDHEHGEQRACREWLETNPKITLIPWRQHSWAGQSFLVRRSDTPGLDLV